MKGNNHHSLSIIHQNIQSLGNSVDQLQHFLQHQEDCKILCLSEHWKTEEQLKQLPIQTFQLASAQCRGEGSHGGVAVYVNETIRCTARKKLNELSIIGTFECAVAECFLGETVIVVCIYRPPTGDIVEFLTKAEMLLNNVCSENKVVLIAGDFNIDMIRDNKNKVSLFSLRNHSTCIPQF